MKSIIFIIITLYILQIYAQNNICKNNTGDIINTCRKNEWCVQVKRGSYGKSKCVIPLNENIYNKYIKYFKVKEYNKNNFCLSKIKKMSVYNINVQRNVLSILICSNKINKQEEEFINLIEPPINIDKGFYNDDRYFKI